MKTGYSFGSLVSFVETLDKTTVKLSGDQTIEGLKGFNQNPYTNAVQGQGGGYLTRKDYVDNALSNKANSYSPTFTGKPTAPTAPLFDAGTTIATTQFVKRALGNHQNYVVTGDATIQPAWAGSFVWYVGAGALYLPDYNSMPMGSRFDIVWPGSGSLIAQAGQNIFLPNGVSVASVTPNKGDTIAVVRLDTGWSYSGTSYTPTAAASDNSTRPASTAFVKNYLLSSPQLAGNVHVEGNVNATGEYQTTNNTGYRIAYGDYGSFWYFDGSNNYLLFTNKGDKWGSYSVLRPFFASCTTGRVTMSHGVSVAGGMYVDSEEVGTNLVVNGHISGKQFIFVDGSWWRDSIPLSVADNYACSAVYDVNIGAVPQTDMFFPIAGATASTANESYTTRVKFGVYSDGTQPGWLRKSAGIWVGGAESVNHPRYLYKFNVYGGFTTGAVYADSNITAGTNINAGGTISAPYLVSTAVNQIGLRFTGGPYGVMWSNSGGELFQLLLTNANDQLGTYNWLRPLDINKRTGLVSHYNGLTVASGLWTDQVHISSTTNSAPTQAAGTNNTTIATTAFVQSMKIEVAKMLYPVGSYYINDTNSTNPAILFGFGSWEHVNGRVLMGCDSTGVGTFGTPGSQGGDLMHSHTATGTALTIDQIPSHTHQQRRNDGTGASGGTAVPDAAYGGEEYGPTSPTGGGQTHTHTIQSTSLLPPYRVVFIWRRTA